MSLANDPRPASAAHTPAPAAELRFHHRRLRQIIGAVAALAVVGGLGAGMIAGASAASAAPLAPTASAPDPEDEEQGGSGQGGSGQGGSGQRGERVERSSTDAGAGQVAEAVRSFTRTLHAAQLAALGTASRGLRLAELDERQRDAALAAVRSSLSEEGYAHLVAAMDADDALDAAAGGGTEWASDRWTLTLLPEPDDEGFFFQFGGSQLAVTTIYADGALVVEPELVEA